MLDLCQIYVINDCFLLDLTCPLLILIFHCLISAIHHALTLNQCLECLNLIIPWLDLYDFFLNTLDLAVYVQVYHFPAMILIDPGPFRDDDLVNPTEDLTRSTDLWWIQLRLLQILPLMMILLLIPLFSFILILINGQISLILCVPFNSQYFVLIMHNGQD